MVEGYEVIVLDNFSTGQVENVRHHLNNQKFNLVKGDVQSSREVNKAIKDVDIVFHLAAFVNVPLSIEDPMLANSVNTRGTLNLLRPSLKKNIARFIYVSTCDVYGEACYLPISEEHPATPLSPYGISKLAAEQYCKVFNRIITWTGFKKCKPSILSGLSIDFDISVILSEEVVDANII
jgi:nucleoside-diphosphate-sugar epimerase